MSFCTLILFSCILLFNSESLFFQPRLSQGSFWVLFFYSRGHFICWVGGGGEEAAVDATLATAKISAIGPARLTRFFWFTHCLISFGWLMICFLIFHFIYIFKNVLIFKASFLSSSSEKFLSSFSSGLWSSPFFAISNTALRIHETNV